ncbi:MAG: hypothetical protein HQM08_27400 [Candidatus Riflebacteria bacterium]|nr:hypothetical protein [Candidatus Riflebacteria bacterium]
MAGRFTKKLLKNLPTEEALEEVYSLSRIFNIPVTEESAAYIAAVTDGDVFYISQIFRSDYEPKDLTSEDCINEIILFETRTANDEFGEISAMWIEYLHDAISRVNDKYGKMIILYLAKQGKQEKTRKEILEDLKLDMTEKELEQKLDIFIKADILSYGSTRFRYKGLGDKFFEIIFKEMYQEEIDSLDIEEIRNDIKTQLKSTYGRVSFYKGIMAEYQVVNKILFAALNKIPFKELLYHFIEGYELSTFSAAAKNKFYQDQLKFIEVDAYLQSKNQDGPDFIIEVKNWETPVTKDQVEKFISNKEILTKQLLRPTGFIFCSALPFENDLEELLKANAIMIMYLPRRDTK